MNRVLFFLLMVLAFGCSKTEEAKVAKAIANGGGGDKEVTNKFQNYKIKYTVENSKKDSFGETKKEKLPVITDKNIGELRKTDIPKIYKSFVMTDDPMTKSTSNDPSKYDFNFVTAELDSSKFNPEVAKVVSSCTDKFSLVCAKNDKICEIYTDARHGLNCKTTELGKDLSELIGKNTGLKIDLVVIDSPFANLIQSNTSKPVDTSSPVYIQLYVMTVDMAGCDQLKKIREKLPNFRIEFKVQEYDKVKNEAEYLSACNNATR